MFVQPFSPSTKCWLAELGSPPSALPSNPSQLHLPPPALANGSASAQAWAEKTQKETKNSRGQSPGRCAVN